ncbi:hypothetical protein FNV43_RR21740 [Rhamnella rubrinervis]|uniref:Transmembrane protein n=1 Tax=Rhamnella rubrinervis TaxID=2594499 RepID=A0A8K0DVQ2_9ROSA|nr:hypothetical protein FNV43_RR21740 [Rhamnella rubrinervis]
MEWFYPKRRGPEWKQGWTGQTLTSISAPPLHLLTIFGIVIVLLWFSQYTGYKAQLQQTTVNFQLFLMVLPILLIFFMALYSSSGGWFNFQLRRPEAFHRAGGSPWGVAILLVLLLVLLSYQSSFHSKWFGGQNKL